jgi:hypothetical protein
VYNSQVFLEFASGLVELLDLEVLGVYFLLLLFGLRLLLFLHLDLNLLHGLVAVKPKADVDQLLEWGGEVTRLINVETGVKHSHLVHQASKVLSGLVELAII